MDCWICGNIADSEEHKFKSSDLRRHFGKKYNKKNEMLYFSGGKSTEIESYKDEKVKFEKVICIDCNNNRTKLHDDAYDIFAKYILNSYDKLLEDKRFDFLDIFGIDWINQKKNLYRYFAKHAGCKIVTGSVKYNVQDIAEFILGKDFVLTYKLHFQLKEGIKYLVEHFKGEKYAHLYNAPTIFFNEENNTTSFAGWTSYQWISTNWIMSHNITNNQKVDFNKQFEVIEIKYLKDCSKFTSEMSNVEIMLNIENQGLSDINDSLTFFRKLMI